jgi:hypothetical protein
MSDDVGTTPGEEEIPGVSDGREKHVTVRLESGERIEHGEVYLCHANDAFYVSAHATFPEDDRTRYPKSELLRVEVGQHHSACFVTTATAGEGPTLDALRGFRDDAMGRTAHGRALVGLYYAVSPPVAATLERHPHSRTAGAVRWLVERCGALARRREETNSSAERLALSTAVTLGYVVGLAAAIGGHAGIRVRETTARYS